MKRASLLVWCALLLPATAPESRGDSPSTPPAPSPRPHPGTVGVGLELNRLLRQSRARILKPSEVTAGIARLGTASLPPALLVLEERAIPAVDGADRQVLSEPQEAQLLDAMRAFPSSSVLEAARLHLEQQGAAHAPLAARVAVAEAVGTCGKFSDLIWLCGLLGADASTNLDPDTERAFSAAAREMLKRDPDGLTSLAFEWHRLPKNVTPAVVTAAGADGDPRAVAFLGDVLVHRPDLSRLALSELARQRAPEDTPRTLLDELHARLAPDQPMECRAACTALAALGDFSAADKMVNLLSVSDEGLRTTAHESLKTLSGMHLPVEVSGWKSWLAEEKIWYSSREPALALALERGRPATAMDALAEIAEHRWERHRLAQVVAGVLQRGERPLKVRACAVLQLLASPRSRDALTIAAHDDGVELATAAKAALAALPNAGTTSPRRSGAAERD
jgi:hypothetical protein